MRAVLDTNVLLSSIFWNGDPYHIVKQALNGKFEIITSKEIFKELRKVLTDPSEKFQLSNQET